MRRASGPTPFSAPSSACYKIGVSEAVLRMCVDEEFESFGGGEWHGWLSAILCRGQKASSSTLAIGFLGDAPDQRAKTFGPSIPPLGFVAMRSRDRRASCTNSLFSPKSDHGPRGTSEKSTNFQSVTSIEFNFK